MYAITRNGDIIKSKSPVTLIKDNRNIPPRSYLLSQNYPNPFNPSTRIRYELPVESKVTIKIYDILGREIATLLNETRNAGKYEVMWNSSNYANGIYLYAIKAYPVNRQGESYYSAKKMILLK